MQEPLNTTVVKVRKNINLTSVYNTDAPYFAKYLNDINIYNNTLTIPYPYSLKDAEFFIQRTRNFEKEYNKQNNWAIRKEDGGLIGGIGLLFNHGVNSHKSEIGYWLAKPYRGQGIMTDVVKKFCEHCHELYGLVRLEALIFPHNPGSMRVAEKAGFEREGFLKKVHQKKGEYVDGELFAKVY